MIRVIRPECAHFRGSKPCDPHKEHGVVCEDCSYFARPDGPVCIIKLGAMGDVLRTMALLPDIKERHPHDPIIWITERESVPLLRSHPLVADAIAYEPAQNMSLPANPSTIYSLDNSEAGVLLDSTIRGGRHLGFRAGASGKCEGVWPGGDPKLFELGLWDDLKKKNRESYLQMLARSAGLEYSGRPPNVHLSPAELAVGAELLSGLARPIVGINTGAGERWLRKRWNLEHVSSLTSMLLESGCSVALFGGAQVGAFNRELAGASGVRARAIETAEDARMLCAAISALDVLVTGDTLAMHAAWAESTPTVALFGPTSLAEIDLGDQDIKLATDELTCLGCYLHTCSVDPHCMDLLRPKVVMAAVSDRLSRAVNRCS